ncbi:MAG: ABC transporter ATP-binding protein [Saprospiraceae bacterium]|nr:ABC transporter ATP-binding protein [Saprospiraceae bacterium]
MKPIIAVRDLSKVYQIGSKEERYYSLRDRLSSPSKWFGSPKTEPFYALKDINFDIYPGETVGIIGRNGAGKSTLLKILSRITPPTTGSIKLRGRVASLLEVGTGFHPELTGRENVYFNGAILGLKKHEIQKKFDEIIDFSGVETFLDTPLKKYSSGMQLRLAFAVAAHLDPEILLVDEVLSVGDAEFQKKCLGKMESVSKGEGRTVVVVSHDLGMIEKITNNSILLTGGEIIDFKNTNLIIKKYKNSIINSELISKRFGNKKIQIIKYKILNESNILTNYFYMGDDIHINFQIFSKELNSDFELAINFKNEKDEIITHITSFDSIGKLKLIGKTLLLN